MTPEDGFLIDILCHPDDPAPRLIYSDWLQDQGDPRWEWVRKGCELLKLPRGSVERRRERDRFRRAFNDAGHHWPETEGLPMSWDGLVSVVRYRLAQTMAWCAGRGLPLRSAELSPGPEYQELVQWRSGAPADLERWALVVQNVALRRGDALAALGRAPRALAEGLGGGRLLVYLPELGRGEAVASRTRSEYLDEHLVPAWDSWVMYGREAPPDEPYGRADVYVLSWAPPHLVADVERLQEAAPQACLVWAED